MAGKPDQDRKPRTVLEHLLWQRQEDTYDDVVRTFNATAEELRTDVTITVRHLTRLASGERRGVSAPTRRVLQRMFGMPVDDLLRPWTDQIDHGDLTSLAPTTGGLAKLGAESEKAMVTMAAQRARKFSMLNQGTLTPETLEQVHADLSRLAVDYQVKPLGRVSKS